MLARTPGIALPLVLGLVAGIVTEIGRRNPDFQGYFYFSALVLAGFTLFTFLDWFLYTMTQRYFEFMNAKSMTAQSRIIQDLGHLNDRQIAFAHRLVTKILILPGFPNPVNYLLKVGDEEIPFEFIKRFISLGDAEHLCPVSQWADGTNERAWATLITNELILMGYADVANGNRSARWLNRRAGLQYIGLINENGDERTFDLSINTLDWTNQAIRAKGGK